jgi:N-acetylglutamate synthase-like GNAT family acetyltransferase
MTSFEKELVAHSANNQKQYIFSDNLTDFDFDLITAWLASTYWSPGISREKVIKGSENSTVCVGVFHADGIQVAFARCISDTTRFAYIADVFVDEAYRNKGIAQEILQFFYNHPKLNDVSSFYLLTQDAQKVYEKAGFGLYPNPERFMVKRRNE